MDQTELAQLSARLDRHLAELKADHRSVVVREGAAIREDLVLDLRRIETDIARLRSDLLQSTFSLRMQIYLVATVLLVALVLAG